MKKIYFLTLFSLLSFGPSSYSFELPSLAPTKKTSLAIAAAGAAVGTYYGLNAYHDRTLHWNWNTIDTAYVYGQPIENVFKKRSQEYADTPTQWLWGAGTASHQVEGNCTNNNWYWWCKTEAAQSLGKGDAGVACDQWNRYENDIQLLKQAGLNTYRFSVEWSKVMPTPDTFDEQALDHYENLCKALVAQGIKPVVTLFHYTVPIWFMEKGDFARAENSHYFVTFCKKLYERLHPYVHMWLTFNTPEGHAMQGWVYGQRPPGIKNQYPTALDVMHTMLEAHVMVYRALKEASNGRASVGFLKNIFQVDPYDVCNPLDHLVAYLANDLVNQSMYRFLTTGEYTVWIPGKAEKKAVNEWIRAGNRCTDFIGLNYYCHGYAHNLKVIRDDAREIPTQNAQYTIYGEGLYRAIQEIHTYLCVPLHIPLYVTENGIAAYNENERTLFYQRYMYALAKAIADGYDVRGYITWSLLDNYEWGQYDKRYGLYHVNFDTQERTLKEGAHYYVNLVKATL